MIGEAGVPHDDVSYTGDEGDSYFSMQKYRNQATEFQGVMNAMDTTAGVLRGLLQLQLSAVDYASVQNDLSEFESRKLAFRAAAETINAVGYAINAAGGRFPVLQVPQGLQGIAGRLGLGPVIPLAAIAALATAATLVSWGRDWMTGVNRRLHDEQLLAEIEDPAQRAEAAQLILQSNAALAEADSSTLSKVAAIAKWGLLAMLAYYGYRMWENR
jgi:hypothetical protein